MAKENENLESTEETVEEVVADKDTEQEQLNRQKEEEESIALASEKAKEKAKRAKTKKTRDAVKTSSGAPFLRGLVLVAVSALVGAGAMYVSLGNKTTEETILVSMKGDTVTVGDVFNSLKGSNQTQQSVLSATMQKVLEKEYGSKVSKEDVDKAYKQASEQYRDQFSQVLAAYGQPEESYRTQIRTQKLVEYAVNQAAQKDLTEANYKAAYDNYTPNTEVQVVSTTDKAVAEEVDAELKAVTENTSKAVEAKMEELRVADAITEIFTLFKRCNKYIDETMPWALAKEEDKKDRLAEVLYNLVEGICIGASLLESFMPETTEKILAQLNAPKRTYEELDTFGLYPAGNKVTEKPEILFARLDIKEVMEKVEAMKKEEAEKAGTAEEKKEEPVIEIEAKPEITFDDFMKMQFQVGEIIACEEVKKSKKLLCSQVKIGNQVKQIVSGIKSNYKPEDMVGKKVMVLVNLKPAKLAGVLSEGMLLCAEDENGKLALMTPDKEMPAGAEIC